MTVVARSGPPRVVAYTSSNSCSALMVSHTSRNRLAGANSGTVMVRNRVNGFAPSIAAASCSSAGTPCSAARYTITEKPVQPQIVIATMTYMAWVGDAKNGCDGAPIALSAALTRP